MLCNQDTLKRSSPMQHSFSDTAQETLPGLSFTRTTKRKYKLLNHLSSTAGEHRY